MNLTPMMCRLTKARADRLRLTVFVAPGRAADLVAQFKSRDIYSWAHSDTTVRVEDPLSVAEFYERVGIMDGAIPHLRAYAAHRALLRPGTRRDPAVVAEVERQMGLILELQGD